MKNEKPGTTWGGATQCVWGGEPEHEPEGTTVTPVFHGVTYAYDDLEEWRATALGEQAGHTYSRRIFQFREINGATLDANSAFLLARGLRTLALRVERQNSNAQAVVEFLTSHSAVADFFYPGLPDHAGHEVACRQMRGFGGCLPLHCGWSWRRPDIAGRPEAGAPRGEPRVGCNAREAAVGYESCRTYEGSARRGRDS